MRQAGGTQATLPLDAGVAEPLLLGGELLWSASDPDGSHVLSRALADWTGPPIDHGGVVSHFSLTAAATCRSGDARYAAYKSPDDSALVRAGAPGLVPFTLPWNARYSLTCAGEVATFTWNDFQEVHQLRCAGQACTRADAALAGVPTDASVTAIGDRVVAIWSSDVELPGTGREGEHGLLWVRSAPIADFARTPDTLLLEGGAHLRAIHPHAGNFVALVSSDDGTSYALELDGQGGVSPVRASPPRP